MASPPLARPGYCIAEAQFPPIGCARAGDCIGINDMNNTERGSAGKCRSHLSSDTRMGVCIATAALTSEVCQLGATTVVSIERFERGRMCYVTYCCEPVGASTVHVDPDESECRCRCLVARDNVNRRSRLPDDSSHSTINLASWRSQ